MTTIRNQTCDVLARLWKEAREHADNTRDALIDALAPRVREVYFFVGRHAAHDYPITSAQIAEAFKVSIQDAGTMLKELHDYGLLVRYEKTNESGKFYLYAQAE